MPFLDFHTNSYISATVIHTNPYTLRLGYLWYKQLICTVQRVHFQLRVGVIFDIVVKNKLNKKRAFCELFFHFPLMKVVGSTETLGLL